MNTDHKEYEDQIWRLKEEIKSQRLHMQELQQRLKAKNTVWHVKRKLSDGNFLCEKIIAMEPANDGVHITIAG